MRGEAALRADADPEGNNGKMTCLSLYRGRSLIEGFVDRPFLFATSDEGCRLMDTSLELFDIFELRKLA